MKMQDDCQIGLKMDRVAFAEAVEIVRAGNPLIYPTETFYALGGNALDHGLVREIFEIKKRQLNKPLPLIAADLEMCSNIARFEGETISRLGELFWPGPLSVVLELVDNLPGLLKDAEGRGCLRVSSHPWARRLSAVARCPLVATSANFSGQTAQKEPSALPISLLSLCPLYSPKGNLPRGGKPSTIVEPLGEFRLRVLRPGAVPVTSLERAGFVVVD